MISSHDFKFCILLLLENWRQATKVVIKKIKGYFLPDASLKVGKINPFQETSK